MKLSKILLTLAAACSLASCEFPGLGGGDDEEGKNDPTLYELKISTNLEKAKNEIKAEFKGERDEDEIESLKEAGATQEDIDKAGTCVDGTYYFFDQDPINLYEPFIPGYEFLGWFEDGKFLGFLDTNYDGIPDYIWNMNNKNTTLEARYKLLKFDILYMDDTTNPVDPKGNPTTWSIEDGEVELKHKDRTDEGLEFLGWTFAMGGDTRYDGYVTKLNEEFLIASNVAHASMEGRESTTFSLHENYKEIQHNVKLTFDTSVIESIQVEITPPGGTTYTYYDDGGECWIKSGSIETALQHGSEVLVYAALSYDAEVAGYEVDGIYYGTTKISQKTIGSGNRTAYKITASQDATVELIAKLPA